MHVLGQKAACRFFLYSTIGNRSIAFRDEIRSEKRGQKKGERATPPSLFCRRVINI